MWQRLERKISFLCLFVYFIVIFFFTIHISLFFLLTFFVIRIFFPSAFFYPHFPIRIRHPQVSGPRFTDTLFACVYTHASSLSNFCRLSFFEFEECLNKNFHPLKYFPSHRILKSCSQKFTDHLNAVWYRLQVTAATNGFTFQIINSWLESWPGLTLIPPSETCESFWAIFAFTTLFIWWNQRAFTSKFFICSC